jgi:hypothetical protein
MHDRANGLRRIPILGTSVNNESTFPKLRVDVAGAIISHSLSSSRDVSVEDHPRAIYCQGLYFVALARTLFPIHHPLVFPKKLPRIPEEDPPQEGRMEGLHLSVRLALEDRHAQCP